MAKRSVARSAENIARRATVFALVFLFPIAPVLATSDLAWQAQRIETYLHAYPKRALSELDALAAQPGGVPSERRFVHALHGQSMILVGRTADALALADRLAAQAKSPPDDLTLATALLLRSRAQLSAGDAAKANVLAADALELARNSGEQFLPYWAAITLGTSARVLGRLEEALASAQDALSLAENMNNPLRRSNALYQLSVLYLVLKKPQDALKASQEAFAEAEVAGSAYGMANARMAESAALEVLEDPARELAAMEEALAIARTAQSQAAESRALINLADIRLRRKEFKEALELARNALQIATDYGDASLIATSKANMGFALFGLNRVPEGKRLADESLAEYERSGATAEIAIAARRVRALPGTSGRPQGGACPVAPGTQAQRRDRAGRAPEGAPGDSGKIRVGQAQARNRAAQPGKRTEVRGTRNARAAAAHLVAARVAVRAVVRRGRRVVPETSRHEPIARRRGTPN